jgi:hypothetical protein
MASRRSATKTALASVDVYQRVKPAQNNGASNLEMNEAPYLPERDDLRPEMSVFFLLPAMYILLMTAVA